MADSADRVDRVVLKREEVGLAAVSRAQAARRWLRRMTCLFHCGPLPLPSMPRHAARYRAAGPDPPAPHRSLLHESRPGELTTTFFKFVARNAAPFSARYASVRPGSRAHAGYETDSQQWRWRLGLLLAGWC